MTEAATPGYRYSVLDVDENNQLGDFEELTGGDIKIDMVTYTIVTKDGSSTTKYMPGQTSFAPVVLKNVLTPNCEDTYKEFKKVSAGNVIKKHFTVTMFDGAGEHLVTWDLIDAIITGISGFRFSKEYLVGFEVTLQAESIIVNFLAPPTEE